MTYNEQIKALIDEVRPQFGLLGMYAFRGEGDPEAVTNAFVQVAEAYLKAKQLTQDTFGSDSLEVAPGSTLCAPEGTIISFLNLEIYIHDGRKNINK